MSGRSVRAWLDERAQAYGRVITVLCLNLPLVALALARHLEGVPVTGLGGLYAGLVFLGYYALALIALVSVGFVVAVVSRRLAFMACGALLTVALFYLVTNSFVYRLYRLHVDVFWLQYLTWSYSGQGITSSILATAAGVLAGIVALEVGLFYLAARVKSRGKLAAAFVVTSLIAFAASQVLHIVAYERDDSRVTTITTQLPLYHPITSHRRAVRYGDLVPLVRGSGGASPAGELTTLRYPLREVTCQGSRAERPPNILLIVLESWRYDAMDSVTTPNIHALARRSSVFLNHFSSGNTTPHGVFGLFYGIHPTYWTAVKANAPAIDNPVLIDALQENGYALGIYAPDSRFDRHKIKDAVFRGIAVHESFQGGRPDQRDRDLSRQLLAFMRTAQRRGQPFFASAFYKSTHFSYYYPDSTARFRPSRDLNVALTEYTTNLTPYVNDYRNAVAYVDRLLGELLQAMAETGLLDSTIVVITSDHGEELNDNRTGHWGHTGNFTSYQARVPMVVYVPGRRPRQVRQPTAHVDLPATLLQGALRCGDDVGAYANGFNLLGPLPEARPIVLGGYTGHAIVIADDVYAITPMQVRRYKLDSIRTPAGPPRPDLMLEAVEGMQRFYLGTPRPSPSPRTHVTTSPADTGAGPAASQARRQAATLVSPAGIRQRPAAPERELPASPTAPAHAGGRSVGREASESRRAAPR